VNVVLEQLSEFPGLERSQLEAVGRRRPSGDLEAPPHLHHDFAEARTLLCRARLLVHGGG
jgi:hypothetical protein